MSCCVVAFAHNVLAEGNLSAGASLFREQGGPLHMDVIMPSVNAAVDLAEPLQLRLGWTADIVSGASVAVVATALLIALVLVEAISWHESDRLLYTHLGPLLLIAYAWLACAGVVVFAPLRR